RRAFDEALIAACERAAESGSPVTLVLLNVVGTRAMNEARGHAAGDSLIQRAAVGMNRAVRGSDFSARIGGDDFGVILAGADVEIGKRVARRIAQETERLNLNEWLDEPPLSLTFGVASGIGCSA